MSSTKERLAIYAGTFDPITNGHLDVIDRAANLFDRVVVTIAVNSQKRPLFSDTERIEMTRQAIGESLPKRTNIEVDSFTGLLVEYARKRGAIALVRGVRVLSDFEYEFQMALMNRKMAGDISTVFLMPDEKYTYLTSSIVRELASHGQDVSQFVPKVVAEALRKKFGK